jgi:hypothetical protein
MEAEYFFETLRHIHHLTRRHILEDYSHDTKRLGWHEDLLITVVPYAVYLRPVAAFGQGSIPGQFVWDLW